MNADGLAYRPRFLKRRSMSASLNKILSRGDFRIDGLC